MIRQWVPGILTAILCGLLTTAVSSAAAGPALARSVKQQPLALHLRWRVVTREISSIATSDRYLALLTYPDPNSPEDSGSVVLRDEQTNTQRLVALPSACEPNRVPRMFGGPWLVVGCRGASDWLYNLNSRQWVAVCNDSPGGCNLVGVGRYWLKLDNNVGCQAHCGNEYVLQNLQTGQVKPDPATPGGRTLDDLNAPSGAAPLCAPLRYPASQNPDVGAPELGTLEFSGPFALASGNSYSTGAGASVFYRLERCGSPRVLAVHDASTRFAPLMSSRAVVSLGIRQDHCKQRPYGRSCTNHSYIRGIYLPGLRQFTASLPSVKVPTYSWPGEVVGLTRRTIYVQAPAPGGPLWAATLPQPSSPHHQ